jgi:hypothetical protein
MEDSVGGWKTWELSLLNKEGADNGEVLVIIVMRAEEEGPPSVLMMRRNSKQRKGKKFERKKKINVGEYVVECLMEEEEYLM